MSRQGRSIERWMKPLAFVLCLLPAVHLVSRFLRDDLGANPINELEIETGLWTLRLLAVTLAVTPARRLTGVGALARYRRMLGLFVFFYACVHVSMWVAVDWFFDWRSMGEEIVKHKYILVGMATFILLVPLAVTSTNGWVRRLGGRRWNRLHRLVYLCAVGGTVHYLWAVKKDTFFPVVYFLVFAALLGYRAWLRWGGKPRAGRSLADAPSRRQPSPQPSLEPPS